MNFKQLFCRHIYKETLTEETITKRVNVGGWLADAYENYQYYATYLKCLKCDKRIIKESRKVII